jgi:ABC-type uncharacterized transport system substrate-binding protein
MHRSKGWLYSITSSVPASTIHSGSPAFRSPSINSFALDCPPRAIHPDVVKEGSVSSSCTAASRASASRPRSHQIGVDFQVFDASRPEEFEGAFERMTQWRADVLLLFTSPMFYVNYPHIVDLAARQRLPTMHYFREAVEGGGLMGYGADITDLFRLAAKHVARILKGTKPGDLPVEQPTKFEFLINLKTAKALGVTISPTLIARADEVIE